MSTILRRKNVFLKSKKEKNLTMKKKVKITNRKEIYRVIIGVNIQILVS